jgi:hypothetical protein
MSSLTQVIDPKILKIMLLFLSRQEELYHLQKISQEAKVPLGTTFRLVKRLGKAQFLETITVGKTKLYRMNKAKKKEFEVLLT